MHAAPYKGMNSTYPDRIGIRASNRSGLTTAELAQALNIRPETIRNRLCSRGSYYGLIPEKGGNGRLRWPADSIERFYGYGSSGYSLDR